MKSLSATESVTGSSASVGGPPRTPANVRATPSIRSLLRDAPRVSGERPRIERVVRPFEQEIRDQSDDADHDDAEDDLAGVEKRLAVGDHVADTARCADQLGDDHVRPRPTEHQTQ